MTLQPRLSTPAPLGTDVLQKVGDKQGHPFRGNQYTDGLNSPEFKYAQAVLSHKSGDELDPSVEEFGENFTWDGSRYPTQGDWARATYNRYIIRDTIQGSQGILDSGDRKKLQRISEVSGGFSFPYKTVIESKSKSLNEIDTEKLGEWGYEKYGLIPSDAHAIGWWDAPSEEEPYWIIHVVPEEGVNIRETWWHEFGHTLSDHVITHYVGSLEGNQLSGDRMDRFAQYMSKISTQDDLKKALYGTSPLPPEFWADERRRLALVLKPYLTQIFELGSAVAREQLAQIGIDFTLANELAIKWAEQYMDTLLTQLMDTTIKGTGIVIADWLESSTATMGDLLQRLMASDMVYGRDRASRIAITETTRAIAEGQMQSFLDAGVDTWQWNTNRDEMVIDGEQRGVCEICQSLNGVQVKIGSSFGLNRKGEPIIKPPDAHIGDRCWVTPVVMVKKTVGDKEGHPFRGNQYTSGETDIFGQPYGIHTREGQQKMIDYLQEKTGHQFSAWGSLKDEKMTSENDMDLILESPPEPTTQEEADAQMSAYYKELEEMGRRHSAGEITDDEYNKWMYGEDDSEVPLTQPLKEAGYRPTRVMGFSGAVVYRYENPETKHTLEIWIQGDPEATPADMFGYDLDENGQILKTLTTQELQKHMGPGPHSHGSPQSIHAHRPETDEEGLISTDFLMEHGVPHKGQRDPKKIAQLKEYMTKHHEAPGVILLQRRPDGDVDIVDGNHRVELADELDIPWLKARYIRDGLQKRGEGPGHPFRGNQYTDFSLEDPFDRKDSDRHEMYKLYKDWSENFWNSLAPNSPSRHSLSYYVSTGSSVMNSRLRYNQSFGKGMDSEIDKYNRQMDRLFDRKTSILPENIISFRGLAFAPESVVGEMFYNLKPGDIYKDAGYLSTSLSESVARTFAFGAGEHPVVLEMEVPKGMRAIPLSRNNNESLEFELLFPRDTQFEVLSNEVIPLNEGDSYRHIRMRVLS